MTSPRDMFVKFIVLTLAIMGAFGEDYTPGSDKYILQALIPLLNPLNGALFDGPPSVSNAPTIENKNKLPTPDQMIYYNYYAAAMYYVYDQRNLTCYYCLKFRDYVYDHEVLFDKSHDTRALVTLSTVRQEIVVAFRGTFNVWNVVLDALLISGTTSDSPETIKFHQGFYIATMSLYEKMVRTVANYLGDHPDFKIVLTGHSLGAAMARLTYFFLDHNQQFPKAKYELYTYGEPRVGNKFFAKYMNSRPITTVRMVARADIFPHLPPTSIMDIKLVTDLVIGDYYVHPQTEFWINGEAYQKFCRRNLTEDPKCSMSMGPLYSAADHLTYFDVNLGTIIGQPLALLELPLGLLNPAVDLPPLPKLIENLIGGLGGGLVRLLSPALG